MHYLECLHRAMQLFFVWKAQVSVDKSVTESAALLEWLFL